MITSFQGWGASDHGEQVREGTIVTVLLYPWTSARKPIPELARDVLNYASATLRWATMAGLDTVCTCGSGWVQPHEFKIHNNLASRSGTHQLPQVVLTAANATPDF